MALGLYDTAVQIKAVELMQPTMDFLFKTLVTNGGVVAEDEMLYDYKKGAQRAAPFVMPRVGGVVMEREGFVTNKIMFADICPKRVIEADMLSMRGFGEKLLGDKTAAERAKRMVAGDLKFMKDAIQVRRSAMVGELLRSGKMNIYEWVEGGRINPQSKVVDFGFTNKIAVTTPWTAAGSDPNADMYAAEQLVRKGLGVPAFHIMRSATANALINNATFQQQLDNRRMNLGGVMPKYMDEPGLEFIGYNAHNIPMYAYDGYFLDDKFDAVTGNVIGSEPRYFIEEGQVVCAAPGLFKMYHGPITQINKEGEDFTTHLKPEVPKVFKDAKTDMITQQLRSRPMFVPFNVDAWAVVDGVTV